MQTVRVQQSAIDIAGETASILSGRTDIGGLGSFIGTVRGTAGPNKIQSMTLEHYPGMTERALAGIAGQAIARWPLLGVTIIHRVGRLLPGEPIVLVLAASAHRQAALEATAFLIDWLKTKAPFWKQETLASGERAWVAAAAEDEVVADRWIKPAS